MKNHKDNNKQLIEKFLSIIGWVLLLIIFIFTVGTYFNHDIIGGMLALELSDTMYLPTLFKDLILENGQYSDWYFAPAPYFFPDMFLYFIAGFLDSHFYYSNIIFILLQKIIFFISILYIFTSFYSKQVAFFLATVTIIIFYMVPTSFSTFLIKGNWHFGVTLVGVAILSLVIGSLSSQNNKWRFSLLFVLSTLCVTSDKLFVLQFAVPIILTVTLMLLYKIISISFWFKLNGLMILSVIFGYIIYDFVIINKTAYPITYSFSHIYPNAVDLAGKFLQFVESNIVFAIINFTIISIIIFQSIKTLLSLKKVKNDKKFFLGSMYLLSLPLIIGVLLVSDLEMANRYLIPIVFLPLIIILAFLSSCKSIQLYRHKNLFITFTIILVLLPSLGWCFYKLKDFNFKNDYYPNYIKCVDEFLHGKNAQYGVANYWVSKRFSMINKLGYKLVNVNKNLKVIHRISTAGWDQKKYDFVISNIRWNNNPDIQKLQKTNEFQKFSKKTCGFIEVYHFEKGFKLP